METQNQLFTRSHGPAAHLCKMKDLQMFFDGAKSLSRCTPFRNLGRNALVHATDWFTVELAIREVPGRQQLQFPQSERRVAGRHGSQTPASNLRPLERC